MNCTCTKCVASKARWAVRQLLPLTYRTQFRTDDGQHHYGVWQMWFGRVFNYDDVIYDPNANPALDTRIVGAP